MKEPLIVRLAGNQGQYEIRAGSVTLLRELNELDNQIVALLERSQAEMRQLLEQMAKRVEAQGEPVEGALIGSDLILPPADLTLAEAAQLFVGEGIFPR